LRPKICVTILARTTEKTLKAISNLNIKLPDLIEIRFDYSEEDISPKILRKATSLPLIATCRQIGQGGVWKGKDTEKLGILVEAAKYGYEYIDIELDFPQIFELAHQVKMYNKKIILSDHNFLSAHTSTELDHVLKRANDVDASICKVIGTAQMYEDNLNYLNWLGMHPGNIAFAMGPLGIPSRVFSALIGGAFTYAAVKKGQESANGQQSLTELRKIYKAMRVKI
jgi:3-dehydroquinate dehydratase type I